MFRLRLCNVGQLGVALCHELRNLFSKLRQRDGAGFCLCHSRMHVASSRRYVIWHNSLGCAAIPKFLTHVERIGLREEHIGKMSLADHAGQQIQRDVAVAGTIANVEIAELPTGADGPVQRARSSKRDAVFVSDCWHCVLCILETVVLGLGRRGLKSRGRGC